MNSLQRHSFLFHSSDAAKSRLIAPLLWKGIGARLFIFLLITSCKNPIQKIKIPDPVTDEKKKEKPVPEIYQLIKDHEFKPGWMSAKAGVHVESDSKNAGFNITLRIKKDSAIWISVSPLLGIEAARVYITRDSIKFMDRINDKYKITDFGFLNELLRMRVNYDIVEALMLGNFFAYRDENKFNSVYVEEKYYILSTFSKRKLKRSLEEKDPDKPIVQDIYIDDQIYRVQRHYVEDDKIKKMLDASYHEYLPADSTGLYPHKVNVHITAEKPVHIEIEYSKVVVNIPQEMPFSIPAHYEMMK